MKDCRDCQHSQYARGSYLCLAFNQPKPTSWMRDDRNECGTKAILFEPKANKRFAPYDEDE